jgi:hypothetical protein
MTHAGRTPLGPALVEHLDGSQRAKQRLKVILGTIAGQLTIEQACRQLEIQPAMFYRLRTEVLEAGLARLEPRPMGRPPHVTTAEQRKCEELQLQLDELQDELEIAQVREEIAQLMPHLVQKDDAKKKRPTSRHCRSPRRPGSSTDARTANCQR